MILKFGTKLDKNVVLCKYKTKQKKQKQKNKKKQQKKTATYECCI